MRGFTITKPFNLDWRLVAPANFDVLELFITPELSIKFEEVSNGKVLFRIGSFMMQDANSVKRFEAEYMPQRSKERIVKTFSNPNQSVFFSEQDAKTLYELFETEKFICRKVHVCINGSAREIESLKPTDFEKVCDIFAHLKVLGVIHFEDQATAMKNMQDAMEQSAYERIKEDMQHKTVTSTPTKIQLIKQGSMAAAAIAGSAVILSLARKVIQSESWWGKVGGGIMYVAGWALGWLGKKMSHSALEYVKAGVVYV